MLAEIFAYRLKHIRKWDLAHPAVYISSPGLLDCCSPLNLVLSPQERNIVFSSNNPSNQSDSVAHSIRAPHRPIPIVDLTVISHLHQQQCCWILCWNPSLVFQCALIADWPDWDCRHQSYFLFPVTSCSIFPSSSSPVSTALRVT